MSDCRLARVTCQFSLAADTAESQGSWRNLPVWCELLCYGQIPRTCYSQGAEELYRQLEGAKHCIDHVKLYFVMFHLSCHSDMTFNYSLRYG